MTFTSYAQNLEDVILWRALKHVDGGFYIDIGAWSPDVDSVTRAFYERRWSGINVEPNPNWHERLTEARPRDINLRVAISQQDGEMPFFMMSNPGLSTLDPSVSAHHVESGLTQTVLMTPTKRLQTIWREYVRDRDVHFLKVDVEGLEKQVIESNDWTTCRPWIAVIEATQPMSPDENHAEWEPILLSAGYVFVYADGLNRYYVAAEHPELIPSFRYPPNVFDDYRSSLIVDLEIQLAESKGREIGALEIVEAQRREINALQRLAQDAQMRANEAEWAAEAARTKSTWAQSVALNPPAKAYVPLRRIEVDLTPLLPGGANGGAKIFVLALLRALAAKHPDVQFILLTRAESHEELASLDAPNVHRKLTLGAAASQSSATGNSVTAKLVRFVRRALRKMPRSVHRLVHTSGVLQAAERRAGIATVEPAGTDLLFCPFTAPYHARADLPVVSVLYDLQYRFFPEFFDPAVLAERNQTFVDACRTASRMVSISEFSRQCAIETGEIPEVRIRTIHIRVEHKPAAASVESDRAHLAEWGLEDRRYILFPANFWPHKNHDNLLIALGMARQQGLPADTALVCTGVLNERGEQLKSSLGRLGLDNAVIMPGFVSDADLGVLLRHAQGLVFPSLYEGFGMPVIEAFALGIPVACSNTTSLPEIAGDAAFLFDPRIPGEIAQGLIWLASDKPKNDGFVARGLARAESFGDVNRMADEYWDVMNEAWQAGRS